MTRGGYNVCCVSQHKATKLLATFLNFFFIVGNKNDFHRFVFTVFPLFPYFFRLYLAPCLLGVLALSVISFFKTHSRKKNCMNANHLSFLVFASRLLLLSLSRHRHLPSRQKHQNKMR
jgi:hypothetical protein